MEKVYRKSALKTSAAPLFNFGKYCKLTNACKKLEIYNYLTGGEWVICLYLGVMIGTGERVLFGGSEQVYFPFFDLQMHSPLI